jgi:hypothetical protein
MDLARREPWLLDLALPSMFFLLFFELMLQRVGVVLDREL